MAGWLALFCLLWVLQNCTVRAAFSAAVLHASCNRCAACVTRFGAHFHPLQIKAQEDVLRQQLADMRAKEAEQGSDIPALIQERDECRCVACGSAAAALPATAVTAGCRLGCLLP